MKSNITSLPDKKESVKADSLLSEQQVQSVGPSLESGKTLVGKTEKENLAMSDLEKKLSVRQDDKAGNTPDNTGAVNQKPAEVLTKADPKALTTTVTEIN